MTAGPCAKRRVVATITCRSGAVIVGTNDCDSPKATCPREPGEGYEKCVFLCEQPGHAEIMALCRARSLGHNLIGATARVTGINWMCRKCADALSGAGIVSVTIEASP